MPAAATPKHYAVTLDPADPNKGLRLVSLVKTPAIGQGWVALAAAQPAVAKLVHLSTATEGPQKQVLTGPLLIPDLQIVRLEADGKTPFYISFSAEVIEAAAHRFMQQGTGLTDSNADHATALEGNTIRELWLVADPACDKAKALGLDVPAGTLMCSMHISDADFWTNEILTGNKTGFSIEGLFDFSDLQLSAVAPAAPAPTPAKPMSFITKLRAAFSGVVALATVTLQDGTDLEIDDATGEVFLLNPDGTRGAAQPDGAYILQDGTTLTVTAGKRVAPAPLKDGGDENRAGVDLTTNPPAAGDPAARLDALEKSVAEILAIVKKDAAADATENEQGGASTETKLAAQLHGTPVADLKLDAIELTEGDALTYNPVTRRLSDAKGALVESGYYAAADGSYFQVSTDQYIWQIDKQTYDMVYKVQLQAVELEEARLKLAQTPGAKRVSLSAGDGAHTDAQTPGSLRLAAARAAAGKQTT